ncbi:hypothetical protein [Amedibacillus sp. YH-ame10]
MTIEEASRYLCIGEKRIEMPVDSYGVVIEYR